MSTFVGLWKNKTVLNLSTSRGTMRKLKLFWMCPHLAGLWTNKTVLNDVSTLDKQVGVLVSQLVNKYSHLPGRQICTTYKITSTKQTKTTETHFTASPRDGPV